MTRIRVGLTALMLAGGLLGLAPHIAHAQKNRDVISREDIDNSALKDQDIYGVIRSLRPHFLATPRGVRSMGNSVSKMGLWVDGVHESDIGTLKNMLASTVFEVRYLDPSRAESEYGTAASGGAVVVKRIKDMPATTPPPRDTTKPPHS
ncbi:MAG: hypothetical protein ABI969_06515 [bacterium]